MNDHAVLIADDDPLLRAVFRAVLSRRGCAIDEAADGDEAIRKIRRRRYSAILLDLLMPRVNGFEVLWHLKALHADVLDRVIVLTAISEQNMRGLDMSLARTVFHKPVELASVISEVSQRLD